MRKTFAVVITLLLLALPVWAANKVVVEKATAGINKVDKTEMSFNLQNDQELAGLAVALKFADKNDDVTASSFSFEGTCLEKLSMKEAIIDNVEKTVVVYGIVLQEDFIPAGRGPIVKLTFTGKDVGKVNFIPTTYGKQEGITLVSPAAKEIPYEFSQTITPGVSGNLPKSYALFQNYPNPFNVTTQIRYALPEDAKVRLEIFNILGQRVRVLVDEFQTAGNKQVVWDGRNDSGDQISSGVYFYRINAGKFHDVMKMSLLK